MTNSTNWLFNPSSILVAHKFDPATSRKSIGHKLVDLTKVLQPYKVFWVLEVQSITGNILLYTSTRKYPLRGYILGSGAPGTPGVMG